MERNTIICFQLHNHSRYLLINYGILIQEYSGAKGGIKKNILAIPGPYTYNLLK